jgi:hypothetical protein
VRLLAGLDCLKVVVPVFRDVYEFEWVEDFRDVVSEFEWAKVGGHAVSHVDAELYVGPEVVRGGTAIRCGDPTEPDQRDAQRDQTAPQFRAQLIVPPASAEYHASILPVPVATAHTKVPICIGAPTEPPDVRCARSVRPQLTGEIAQ